MKQANLGLELTTKRTRKREFLDEMNLVVPWAELVALIAPHAPARSAKGVRPPFAVATMLRIYFLQQWFNLSDPAMEEALYDTALFRDFAGLDKGEDHLPDESTFLRFRHLLEANNLSVQTLATVNATLTAKGLLLKQGTVVDATLIAAPSTTKNQVGQRDPEMHQTKKGNQWLFGMKAHADVDADPGLVHSVATTLGTARRCVRRNQRHQFSPRHNKIHLVQELALARPHGLAFKSSGVQAHLFHGFHHAHPVPTGGFCRCSLKFAYSKKIKQVDFAEQNYVIF